jgi:F420-dependent oxidoreductase-like protein
MKLGLQIPYLTWPGGAAALGPKLGEIARAGEDAGYDSIWLMDHYFQIPGVGTPEMDMLEAYTALGFIAAHTTRAKLGTLVTGVTYRHPGLLAKQVTTLDVLSGGRAYLGIGAAWFEREHIGLGVPFPPLKERFQRLEEALQIAKQMWSDDNGPFEGKHYQLAETLNVPQVLSKPHPPIMIGGSGERKTLRLVAKYGDACNIFSDSPDGVRRKFAILHEHCDVVGRNYAEVEKTVYFPIRIADNNTAAQIVDTIGTFAEAGVQTLIGALVGVEQMTPIETVGRDIIPQIRNL